MSSSSKPSNQSGGPPRTSHSSPRARPETIVDVVVDILDDDGPAPMRRFRPAQKRPNGVDRFYQTHHVPYEERGKHSGDPMEDVHNHSRCYPKMRREVDRRRSTAQPTSLLDEQPSIPVSHRHTTRCPICGRFKRKADARTTRQKTQKKTECRVTKRGTNQKRSEPISRALSNISKFGINKNHLYSYLVPSGVSVICLRTKSNSNMDTTDQNSTILYNNKKYINNKKDGSKNVSASNTSVVKSESKSEIESRHPDTSEPSISTYNSDMSMDHEPMVSSRE